MGTTISKGKTFAATETVTNTKLHTLVDSATITKVTDADNDTKIDLEESSDEDIVRFDTAGAERVTIQAGKIEPTTDNDIDLGASGKEFKDLHLDGTANIDSLVADTADINAGTVDATLGGTTPAAVTGTTLKADTSLELATGATVTGIADEDDMVSDSATLLSTQQSIKAFVELGVYDARVKGWIQFNGSGTIAIDDSFNVTSINDEGTGDYTVVWDTDFANDDYACPPGAGQARVVRVIPTTADVAITTFSDVAGTTEVDTNKIVMIAIGDQ